ncbi:hypothetical protein D2Q93_16185 [Alicyclobacillaceae bacterium I2511]|nr:hypothetical protein D2Q93_16185 [Alicyclobacillaceae bacterium I2511]
MYENTRSWLKNLNLPEEDTLRPEGSRKRFSDGAQYRVEIPSCEGPEVLRAVLSETERLQVEIHRVSQGSGIMLMTDAEIREMAQLGAEAQIEVSLFVGPRAGWHLSSLAKSPSGGFAQSRVMGTDMLVHAVEEIKRAYSLGIRSVLVADEGLLWVTGELRRRGDLPTDMKYKVSVMAGITNPATALLLEKAGADTLNVATDLSLGQLAAVRSAIEVPMDVYVEVPDDVGGFVRYYEIPELVHHCAPVYVKYGVRNAPNIYPSGAHLQDVAIKLGRERVRRARIGQELLERYASKATRSAVRCRFPDLGIPVV